MAGSSRTDTPFIEELPRLVEERGRTVHSVARAAGVDPSHLSKVLRQARYKTPSASLTEKLAKALDLPTDYFPEYREAAVVARLRANSALRDSLFDKLVVQEEDRQPDVP